MLYRSHRPAAALRDFIEDFWCYENYASPHEGERILPSGTFELVFNLRSDELRIYDGASPERYRRYGGAVFSGPYSRFFGSDAAEEVSIMGVHFRPGGAFPFLGFRADEFADSHVELAELWKNEAIGLRERLSDTPVVEQRFQLLEKALVRHLFRPLERHPAVATALSAFRTQGSDLRTSALARQTQLSERRFIELFRREVGITPKRFARIHRFQRLLTLVGDQAEPPDWSALADACAYFDQPHLIGDFVAFSGVTPTDFERRVQALRRSGAHMKRHHLAMASPSVFSKTVRNGGTSVKARRASGAGHESTQ